LAAPLVNLPHCAKTAFYSGNGNRNAKWLNQKNSVKTLLEKNKKNYQIDVCCNAKKNIKIQNEFFILISFNFVTLAVIFIAH
jgi:hypothetical protein